MATSISVVKVTYLTMLIMCITLGQMTQAVELCGKIDATLVPCVEYLSRNEHIIPQSCCDGVKNLNAGAKSKEDRQSVCNCIRRMTKNLRGLKPDKLAKLPEQCGVKFPYKLSPSMDCTEVN
ncbi:Non-specific lipid-transfer protein [Arachis hypogaea]|nr:Non-specific lipid-transfer protein [Arachis hypogaea]